MKKILLFIVLLSMTLKSQLSLENTYTLPGRFILTEIAPNEYKYFTFNDPSSQFKLYNMNHSLFMTVNIPVTYSFGTSSYIVSFVTRSLFDCDTTNIEYAIMFLGNGGPAYPTPYFAVYRTNGSLFQKVDSARYLNLSIGASYGTYNNSVPIVNTPLGSKLILGKLNGDVLVYKLCGQLPTSIAKNRNSSDEFLYPYPNPTDNQITLPYVLPSSTTKAQLLIINSAGQVIKEFDIDGNFSSLILNKDDLHPGTYYYHIKSGQTLTDSRKFIIAD